MPANSLAGVVTYRKTAGSNNRNHQQRSFISRNTPDGVFVDYWVWFSFNAVLILTMAKGGWSYLVMELRREPTKAWTSVEMRSISLNFFSLPSWEG